MSATASAIFSRLNARPRLALAVFGLLLLTSGSWILPLLDRDEPRFAEAGREMRQRGDGVVPWFNGDYRFDKPPLIYWCEVAAYEVFGENEFAARLPGALFTVGTALLLFEWGRRLGRARAGLAAALMYLACVQVQIHGRLALADMPMVFFVTLAAWGGWEFTRPGRPRAAVRGWWWLSFGALGMGFLAKGPEAWLPVLGLALFRRWRPAETALRASQVWLGLLVTLGLTLAWAVPALVRTNGQYFAVGLMHHVVYRSVGVVDGHGASNWAGYAALLPFYLLTFFVSFFPWSLRFPGRLRAWWAGRSNDAVGAYLLTQAAVIFVVFTLVRTKLMHYTLPAFPPLALWLALQLEQAPDFPRWLALRLAGMTALVLVLTLGAFAWVRPDFVAEEIWAAVRTHVRPETRVASVGYGEASLVWKFRSVITNAVLLSPDTNRLAGFFQDPGPWIFLAPAGYAPPVPAWTNGAVAVPITGGDVSRWELQPHPFRLGGLNLPGWEFRPRRWELNAWIGTGPSSAARPIP